MFLSLNSSRVEKYRVRAIDSAVKLNCTAIPVRKASFTFSANLKMKIVNGNFNELSGVTCIIQHDDQ